MLYREYEDFDSMFFGINKEVIEEGDNDPEIYRVVNSIVLPLSVFTVKKTDFSVNLGDLMYTDSKLKMLKKDYITVDKFIEFREKLKTDKGKSITFYFNQEKKKRGSSKGHGPCLISFTVCRTKSKQWNEVTVFTKITQLNRRFAADLVMYRAMLKDLSEEVVPEKINIVIAKPYIDKLFFAGQLDYFHIDQSKNTEWLRQVLYLKNDVETKDHDSYKTRKKVKSMLNGTFIPEKTHDEDFRIIE